ncbi:MAG TPA: Crp/Fnr family transcriptional regulator [Steroidobacteraceae bacterium]|jgi:CRP-like cAMP-binding protein|nr:Crp/Fnr family transcriptional regulator [Steroidobacteraceae bacterium]
MDSPLLRKLTNFTPLSDEECRAVLDSCRDVREVGAREDVIAQGDRTGGVKLVLEGFACRYKTLEDGRRQIVAYFVPGDLCDLRVFILKRMDHSIGAIAPSKVATLSPDDVLKMTHTYPNLTRALWWSTLVEEAILREWIVNVGQRNAMERMAHLFCELLYRFRAVGLNEGLSCTLPLTQVELAETLGLSSVHVNRTLQQLRRQNLITLDAGTLTIQNLKRLEELSLFNPEYLHLDYNVERPRGEEREAGWIWRGSAS